MTCSNPRGSFRPFHPPINKNFKTQEQSTVVAVEGKILISVSNPHPKFSPQGRNMTGLFTVIPSARECLINAIALLRVT